MARDTYAHPKRVKKYFLYDRFDYHKSISPDVDLITFWQLFSCQMCLATCYLKQDFIFRLFFSKHDSANDWYFREDITNKLI